jgi:glucose-6-phosphate isomerase
MDDAELWRRYRRWLFDDPASGFRLDVSRMDLPEDLLAREAARLSAAGDAMEALEAGAVANPTEGRRVGHYWLRAPERAPSAAIAREIRETRERVESFAARVRAGEVRPHGGGRFEQLLVVGIGGSALGPQLVAEALGQAGTGLSPRFLDNTDPDGMDRVLAALPLARTLTVVISKSGGTPETRNGMLEAEAAYRARGLDFPSHAVAVTQAGSRLDVHAAERAFLARFPMWDWVGGRTSVLSAVGLLPAALLGIDVGGLLEGAARMDELTRVRDGARNPAALLALAWLYAGGGRGTKDMVILPYKDRLASLGRYLQQLVMESLGKGRDLDGHAVHQGIAVYGNKGSTDQHAYVQQLRDGLPNFFVTFVQVLRDRAGAGLEVDEGITSGDYLHGFLVGTRRALHDKGRPSLVITLRELDARGLGMLIALYERAVGLYASCVRVNAYDQPGVEAGKQAAAAVLDIQRRLVADLRRRGAAGGTCEALARSAGVDDVETAFLVLEHLAANPARGVARTPGSDPFDAVYRWVSEAP